MKADELYSILKQAYLANSLHEIDRDYLGMSGAGDCPRAWYWRTVAPTRDERSTWYAWAGYVWESRVLSLLGVEQKRRTIVATFDGRYRGHTDHEMPDGTLVEVKSVHWERYVELLKKRQADTKNLAQVQAYMRHGNFPNAILVYVCRDIPWWAFDPKAFKLRYPFDPILPFFTVDASRNEAWMDRLDQKARVVLAHMDKMQPPPCECGYCKR